MDEPFMSTSQFAQCLVFKETHKHNLKVMLDGQGADEYLAGYKILFFPAYLSELIYKFRSITFIKELYCIKNTIRLVC